MISPDIEHLMLNKKKSMVIPAENVANVMAEHPLEHALLVLSKVGYSSIPVLDREDHFVGLLSLTEIVNKMLELDDIDSDNLSRYTVAEVMDTKIPTIKADYCLEDVLHGLVDAAYLPVVDEQGVFTGIVTRREILKSVNHTFHELGKENKVRPKLILHSPIEAKQEAK